MKRRIIYILTLSAVFTFLLTSCALKKKVVYFQDMATDSIPSGNPSSYVPVIKSDDLVSIIVLGIDENAVRPFNLPVPVMGSSLGPSAVQGYLVDADGNIDFPVLGKLHIAGMNRMEATEMIHDKLSAYIANPNVILRIMNYKITVLGEVARPGVYTMQNERITLPEALGLAGDLNITGVRKNILVVRDENGIKKEYRIDITSKRLFSSPVYYLKQNDLVYVQPNRAKISSSGINTSNAGLIISSITLMITIISILTR